MGGPRSIKIGKKRSVWADSRSIPEAGQGVLRRRAGIHGLGGKDHELPGRRFRLLRRRARPRLHRPGAFQRRPDPLVDAENPPHRHAPCERTRPIGVRHRLIAPAASPSSRRKARLSAEATVMLSRKAVNHASSATRAIDAAEDSCPSRKLQSNWIYGRRSG